MEYIKCFWRYIDRQTPVLCFYEVDKEEERYTTRNIDIFIDGNMKKSGEYEEFVSEAPCPTIEEINEMDEFKAFSITRKKFEEVWNQNSHKYMGKLDFPED